MFVRVPLSYGQLNGSIVICNEGFWNLGLFIYGNSSADTSGPISEVYAAECSTQSTPAARMVQIVPRQLELDESSACSS